MSSRYRHARSTQHDIGSLTWRERLAALGYILPFVKLVWRTHRRFTLAMVVLRLLRALTPVAILWLGKLIIDAVIGILRGSASHERLWKLVAFEIALVVAGEALSRASALIESLLGDLFTNHTSLLLMKHAAMLDLYLFEDPVFYDKLERARRQTTGRIAFFAQLLTMVQDGLTLISLGAALMVYSPYLLLLLAVAVLPSFLGETHFAQLEYSMLYRLTPERRQLDYLRFIGTSDRTAKEVQMFGLAGWLIKRHRILAERFFKENKLLAIRRAIVSTTLSLVSTAGYYGAYITILFRALNGLLTIGSLTFLAGSFARSRDLIQRLLSGASDISQQSLYLKDLFDFLDTRPIIVSRPSAIEVPVPIKEGFVFEDVSFCYPGSDRWAIRHVSFRLRPGERLAVVGENGAGKTTLTKLLARLYDPTEGRILLDGRNLRDYDLHSMRRAIGVIFQDFVRYDLRFDENIGIGEIGRVEGYLDSGLEQNHKNRWKTSSPASRNGSGHLPVPDSIVAASEKSLAASLLPRFPEGYRQMLGRRFEGGVDLSGGEWQKIGLARAYMRDAQLLILDEPTAALDARAEYEVFERFKELVQGRMAVNISHRFSTVRKADRIIVLQNGSIIQDGTHDQLLAEKGLYAELFALQAEGYR